MWHAGHGEGKALGLLLFIVGFKPKKIEHANSLHDFSHASTKCFAFASQLYPAPTWKNKNVKLSSFICAFFSSVQVVSPCTNQMQTSTSLLGEYMSDNGLSHNVLRLLVLSPICHSCFLVNSNQIPSFPLRCRS
mmetsp:Transcript_37815/g.79729  ORF Transcript_37815/g.79729 Transcript_37815/m.79729 type:complete len:134 (-) Transcript_37815:1255-1656(-)